MELLLEVLLRVQMLVLVVLVVLEVLLEVQPLAQPLTQPQPLLDHLHLEEPQAHLEEPETKLLPLDAIHLLLVDPAAAAACPVTQDSLEPLENLELPENLENQEPLAAQVVHQLFVRKYQFHHAKLAHLVPQDSQVQMEMQETQENPELMVDLEIPEALAHKVPPAPLDHPDLMVDPETKASQESQPFQPPEHLESPAHRDPMAHLDLLETMDQTETVVDPEIKDHQAPMDHQETRDQMANPDPKAPLAMQENRESGEFVPNIAHWTEASFSKMAQEGNKCDLFSTTTTTKNINKKLTDFSTGPFISILNNVLIIFLLFTSPRFSPTSHVILGDFSNKDLELVTLTK